MYKYYIFLIHSSVVGHLGYFHNITIVNSTAINMGMQAPLKWPVSHFFGYIPRSGIAGSYGRSMFRFLRSLQIFFQSGCSSLHSHEQCMGVPFPSHPHQHMLLVVFLMILTGVRWNLSVVLICISFMDRDGEHFFMCFLAIWISSFEKVLFSSVAHYLLVNWVWESLVF
jgi:hypothetical protein